MNLNVNMNVIYHFCEIFDFGCVDIVEKGVHGEVSPVSILERSAKMLII